MRYDNLDSVINKLDIPQIAAEYARLSKSANLSKSDCVAARALHLGNKLCEAAVLFNNTLQGSSKYFVAKEPCVIESFTLKLYTCPECSAYVDETDNFCRRCGQRIHIQTETRSDINGD